MARSVAFVLAQAVDFELDDAGMAALDALTTAEALSAFGQLCAFVCLFVCLFVGGLVGPFTGRVGWFVTSAPRRGSESAPRRSSGQRSPPPHPRRD